MVMINDGDDARLELSLVKYAITVLLAMHWCGCVWGLVAETQRLDAMSSADADADADAAAAGGGGGGGAGDDDDAGGDEGDEGVGVWTWLAALEGGKTGADGVSPAMRFDTPGSKYMASLYFSLYTITSVGYGDIAPQTQVRRVGTRTRDGGVARAHAPPPPPARLACHAPRLP